MIRLFHCQPRQLLPTLQRQTKLLNTYELMCRRYTLIGGGRNKNVSVSEYTRGQGSEKTQRGKKRRKKEELSMTTVSPWRMPATCAFFFSSFTKQIDQIARPAAPAKFPRDLTRSSGGGHSTLWTPYQHTHRVY